MRRGSWDRLRTIVHVRWNVLYVTQWFFEAHSARTDVIFLGLIFRSKSEVCRSCLFFFSAHFTENVSVHHPVLAVLWLLVPLECVGGPQRVSGP